MAVVYLAARDGGRTEVVTLVLTGVAVNALAGALLGLLMFASTDAELRSITFWQLGSVAQATWPKVAAVVPVAVLGGIAAVVLAPKLDLLALGDMKARSLGVPVVAVQVALLGAAGAATVTAVLLAGAIGFIGLIAPHAIRLAGIRHGPPETCR